MATVIVGGGIIGTATAYYLSRTHPLPSSIHTIEAAPRLFASASGYAGGFLAKDWFASSVAPLGALSFDLHRELARQNNGAKRWGYAPSTALSLAIEEGRGMGTGDGGHDWLWEGRSRADVATGDATEEGDMLNEDGTPAWITKQRGGSLETISSEDSCAQVEPLQLCQFLMEECRKRGVQLHMPARATKVVTDDDGTVTGVMVQEGVDDSPKKIACKNILIAAGAWTPAAFKQLFPSSSLKIPIASLAGHSINVRSPRHTIVHEEKYGRCHSVFATPSRNWSFAPEAISRTGGEIYVAGLNSESMPLPKVPTESKIDPKAMQELKKATVQLLGLASPQGKGIHEDDLEVTREALCFRPVARGGKPIITRIDDNRLGKGLRTEKDGGVFVAAGHGPWGISLSLGTGKVMAEMLQNSKLSAKVDGLGMR